LVVVLGSVMTNSAWAGSAPKVADPVTHALSPDTTFYVDPDSEAAHQAITDVIGHDFVDALNMAKLASWPEATWITKGTPSQVEGQVHALVRDAGGRHAVPVVVPYYIPLRDCSQYSAGGAQSDADYQTWIAALAQGLGNSKAVVILEPDGLALLPSDCGQDP